MSQSKRFHICRAYFHVTEPLLILLTWQDKQDLISFVIVLCVKRRENKLYFDYLLTRKQTLNNLFQQGKRVTVVMLYIPLCMYSPR